MNNKVYTGTFKFIKETPHMFSVLWKKDDDEKNDIIGIWEGKYNGDVFEGSFYNIKKKIHITGKWIGKWQSDKEYKGYWETIEQIDDNSLILNNKIFKIDDILLKIKNTENMENTFESLLWTHNMPLNIFYEIMSGTENRFLKYFKKDYKDKGLQFRYGVDSQYGEVIFVMKPGFYIGKKGENDELYPNVQNIFKNIDLTTAKSKTFSLFDKENKKEIIGR